MDHAVPRRQLVHDVTAPGRVVARIPAVTIVVVPIVVAIFAIMAAIVAVVAAIVPPIVVALSMAGIAAMLRGILVARVCGRVGHRGDRLQQQRPERGRAKRVGQVSVHGRLLHAPEWPCSCDLERVRTAPVDPPPEPRGQSSLTSKVRPAWATSRSISLSPNMVAGVQKPPLRPEPSNSCARHAPACPSIFAVEP